MKWELKMSISAFPGFVLFIWSIRKALENKFICIVCRKVSWAKKETALGDGVLRDRWRQNNDIGLSLKTLKVVGVHYQKDK